MTRPGSCTACPLAALPGGNRLLAVRRTIRGDRWSGKLGRASLCCKHCTNSVSRRRTSRKGSYPNRCWSGSAGSPDRRRAEVASYKRSSRPARCRHCTERPRGIADADHFRSCIPQIRSMRCTAECTVYRRPAARPDRDRCPNPQPRHCRRHPPLRSSCQLCPRLRLSRLRCTAACRTQGHRLRPCQRSLLLPRGGPSVHHMRRRAQVG